MKLTTLAMALLEHNLYRFPETGIDWGIAPLPTIPGEEGVNLALPLFTVGVAKNADDVDLAWQVAKVIATEGAMLVRSSPYDLAAHQPAVFGDLWVDGWVMAQLPGELGQTREEMATLLRRNTAVYGRGQGDASITLVRAIASEVSRLIAGETSLDAAYSTLRATRDERRAGAM